MTSDDTLVIDRSVLSFEDCHNGHWIADLLAPRTSHQAPRTIIVGTGPGSFAGIRSAIAFATGYQLGHPETQVLGLTSAAALAAPGERRAVVGDARQGKLWVALFDGYTLLKPVFQTVATSSGRGATVSPDILTNQIPSDFSVISPDDARIGAKLRELFGSRYLGAGVITAAALRAAAEANPALLAPEPRPLYLNPAVRS